MRIVDPNGNNSDPEPDDVPELGVFIDPGSRETGWCVAVPAENFGVTILDAGVIGYRREHGRHPYLRIHDMRIELARLMDGLRPSPSRFVIEVTAGKVNRKRHKGGGAGLAVHGVSVGALWTFGLMWKPSIGNGPTVIPVPENVWKGGFGKLKSAKVAEKFFKLYRPENDPEFNVADAVALAVWYNTVWCRKQAAAKEKQT